MKGFARLLAAEMRKYAHTPVLKIHLVLPLVGMTVFLLYYSFSGWSSAGKVQAYLEVVACIWPFLTGLVCGMAAEMEAEAGYQILLLLPPGRCRGMAAKWLGLLIMGLGSVCAGSSGDLAWADAGVSDSSFSCLPSGEGCLHKRRRGRDDPCLPYAHRHGRGDLDVPSLGFQWQVV